MIRVLFPHGNIRLKPDSNFKNIYFVYRSLVWRLFLNNGKHSIKLPIYDRLYYYYKPSAIYKFSLEVK